MQVKRTPAPVGRREGEVSLTFSNRSEALLGELAARLGTTERHPLDPVVIALPSRAWERHIRFGLARANGIAANLEVHLLKNFFGALLTRRASEKQLPIRLLQGAALQGFLLTILLDEQLLQRSELTPVRTYVWADGADKDAADLRRAQLAAQLTMLFDGYAESRAQMLAAWRAGDFHDRSATETWQRILWLEIFGPRGLAARRGQADGVHWADPTQIPHLLRRKEMALPEEVHLLAACSLPPNQLRCLAALSSSTRVHIYALNPCQEFWEDLDALAIDAPALHAWARPSRDTVRALSEIAGWDAASAFHDPLEGGQSLLRKCQHDILRREPPTRSEAATLDGSLQILACPDVRREAETIAQQIWALIRNDETQRAEGRPPLRFCDIAVLVNGPDPSVALAHLAAAFHGAHELPFDIVDAPGPRHAIAQAALALFKLPLGSFTRQDVLALLTHPALLAHAPDVDATAWVRLCEQLGIVRGADRDSLAGTYVEGDVLSFDQGLRRLGLGAFLEGSVVGEARPFEIDGERYIPEKRGASSASALFARLLRSLIADCQFAKSAVMPIREWAEFFVTFLRAYIAAPNEDTERDLASTLTALQSIADIDVDGAAVGYRTALELATSALDATTSHAAPPNRGVVLSTMAAMESISFRTVFVTGLGDGVFPTPERTSHLDLAAQDRLPSDVTARERDRLLFLETLLSARDQLVLSYVARDPLTGDALQPSSVLLELTQIAARYGLAESQLCRIIPPDGDDLPNARAEAHATQLRENHAAHFGRPPQRDRLRPDLAPSDFKLLANWLSLPQLESAPPAEANNENKRLSLSTLRRFLECPLQGSARVRLGLDQEEDDDPHAVADELLETAPIHAIPLLRAALLDHLAQGLPLEASYERRMELLTLSGRTPSGLFSSAEQSSHLEILRGWRDQLLASGLRGPVSTKTFHFGQADERVVVDRIEDAILLDVTCEPFAGHRKEIRVEIHGKTDPVALDVPGSLLLQHRSGTKAENEVRFDRALLRGFLDHVALSASGLFAREHSALVCTAQGPLRAQRFALIPQAEARDYLAALTSDLLSGSHAYLLPCEAVFRQRCQGGTIADRVSALWDSERVSASSVYGPVPHPERQPPPSESFAQTLIARRFGLFFSAQLSEASS